MELMETCFDKLKKKVGGPLPEPIIGKLSVAVSFNYIFNMSNLYDKGLYLRNGRTYNPYSRVSQVISPPFGLF